MKTRILLVSGVAVLLLAAGWLYRARSGQASGPSAAIAGGDAGGLPRAQPADEHFDPALLERATSDPAAAGLRALVVMRHGHIVFERYAHGMNANSDIDSGGFATALAGLAAGAATQDGTLPMPVLMRFDPTRLRDAIEAVSHQPYAQFLSSRIWKPLNAGAARIVLPAPGAKVPADCCVHARLQDWLRIGGVLVDDGTFEGTTVAPAGWAARMMRPMTPVSKQGYGLELSAAAHAPQPFVTPGVTFVRGPDHWRLWLVPSLKLVVLFGAPGGSTITDAAWDETRLPNMVIGAIADGPDTRTTTPLQQLVPGH